MLVPWSFGLRGRTLQRRGVGAAMLVAGLCVMMALPTSGQKKPGAEKKKSAPWIELPLESVGFPGVSNVFLGSGSSVLTVNFIDTSHLLVTYSLRKLVPRVEHDPGDHDDRLVAGEIVDLPSGHIAAKTEWHMHDHERYLWGLGEGRFLLRIGDRLYTMKPEMGKGEDPFVRTVFPSRPLRPSLVTMSPEGGVLTLETVERVGEEQATKVYLGDQDTARANTRAQTLINFFRVQADSDSAGFVRPAGEVIAASPVILPVDGDGYLWPELAVGGDWAVTFDGYGGKTIDLGKIKSSCFPRLQMISRTEYLALTCQGLDNNIRMASYGLDGQETWEETLGDFGYPTFVFAPAAGRFAVSGMETTGAPPDLVEGRPGPRQEVRIYQNASGDLLLRVDCTPAFKTAENFDLSSDGMLAAVVRNGAIAIYKLPALSKRDQDDMAEIAAYTPASSMADVVLRRLTVRAKVTRASAEAPPDTLKPNGLGPKADDALVTGGGAGPPRKPPTLLKPGEKPEFGTANPEVQK